MYHKTENIKRIITYVLIFLIPIITIISIFLSYNYYLNKEKELEVKTINEEKKEEKKEQKEKYVEPYINELPEARQTYNNQNIMGRIEIPNMNINNYVTRTSDNSYYLNYNLYNVYDQIGAPFFDYRNTNLNTDKQINIYGHNTQNNKILDKLPFTNLEQYTNQDVFNNNKDIYLYIDERKVHYEVIAIKIITDDVEHMNIVFDDNKKFIEHAKKLLSNSLYIRDTEITKKDRLLVLQICHYDPMGSYLLVIGKEV